MADFFGTSVHEMSLDEVDSLYRERVQENIRLEYKREPPQETADFKQVLAKELSSLANTYGGYIIIGIATDQQGIPIAMDGVPPINSFAQRAASNRIRAVLSSRDPNSFQSNCTPEWQCGLRHSPGLEPRSAPLPNAPAGCIHSHFGVQSDIRGAVS
jgi:Putative DNA-binding domain